jgi:hypothetical protein
MDDIKISRLGWAGPVKRLEEKGSKKKKVSYFVWVYVYIDEKWKTNVMSLAILFHFLCAQDVSDINISIIRSLRLCCWITTSVVLFSVRCVLEIWCGWFWVVLVLQAVAQLCFSIPHIKRNGLSARQLKHPVIMIKLLGLPVASFRIRSQNFSQTCCFSVLSICRTSVLLIRKKLLFLAAVEVSDPILPP